MILEIIVGAAIGLASGKFFVYMKKRFFTKTEVKTTAIVPIKKAIVMK